MQRNSLEDQLNILLEKAKSEDLSVQSILDILKNRGAAILLILFSLPFCQPIQIPGFSTLFGILLAIIGLRIAFGNRKWLPQKLLNKKIPQKTLKKVATVAVKIIGKFRYFISARLTWIVQNPILHVAHGMTIFLLSLILALPLPIPLTNILAALPILAFGLGILEDDGLFIIIAYLLTFFCFFTFFSLIKFGKDWLLLIT